MFKKKRLHELGNEGSADPKSGQTQVAASGKAQPQLAVSGKTSVIAASGRTEQTAKASLNISDRQISMTSTASAANDMLADSHSSNIFEESKLIDRPSQADMASTAVRDENIRV